MEVNQLIEKKKTLESDIKNLVEQFQNETKVYVSAIRFESTKFNVEAEDLPIMRTFNLEVEITL